MKTLKFIIPTIILTLLTACAGNRDIISKMSVSTRQDVFQENQATLPVSGSALLKIDFQVKNNKSYFINKYIKHTDPPYTLTINIDGQVVTFTDDPVLKNLSGDFRDNPEVGTGWKYDFKKKLVLQPGKHHISAAVPLSDVFIEKEMVLKEGENTLMLSPEYKTSSTRYRNYPRFSYGLRGVIMKLNNQEL
jgi:hypothetical protein